MIKLFNKLAAWWLNGKATYIVSDTTSGVLPLWVSGDNWFITFKK